ncbi:MAG TPA: thiamine phosphate synthase [Candidatus Coprenecus stercoravium]|uniref:Thiamine-phosphate synthase n=1 Tax=Candidatus Coprenecus stercoravium TaxID=2840735 RepID=A0A9D2GS01_9BACT|nr:thiamine phosphate synthase [Candidatus Coprenecus stercoravium]
MSFQVQFISHFTDSISYLDSIRIALEGGCRWIQLRMKHASPEQVRSTAAQALPLCRRYGAVLILDDHVELVRETGADGVHLGLTDMPVAEARKLLPGGQFIIGGTANTLADIRLHAASGADYIGCGPLRFTTTKDKDKLAPVLGIEGYRSVIDGMRRESLTLPVVGIGGVTAEDIPALAATGLSGIALSGSILRAPDPVAEMRRVINIANSIH